MSKSFEDSKGAFFQKAPLVGVMGTKSPLYKKMENKKYKFRYYYGLVAFFASIVLLIFVCAPLQLYFGMAGLAATELILLLLAVGSALLAKKLTGTGFKEIFPLKVPDAGQIIGAVMVYFGGYMLMLAAAYLSMFFMPETAERAAQLSDFTTTVPFPLAILITAVMPAVCEEALHRGFIMASFRTLKDEPRLKGRTALVKVLVIGLCGLVFGLFHLDPVRLLPTAILGGVFAYMNIKTESILPSVIMHFTNNVFSVISMYAKSALQQAGPDEQLEAAMRAAESVAESSVFTNFRAVAGIAMILAGLALLLLYGGIRMLNRVKRGVGGAYAYANRISAKIRRRISLRRRMAISRRSRQGYIYRAYKSAGEDFGKSACKGGCRLADVACAAFVGRRPDHNVGRFAAGETLFLRQHFRS